MASTGFNFLDYIPPQEIAVGFATSFVIWNVFNYIVMSVSLPDKHLNREDYLDMRNRIVSFFHGIISLALSGYHMYFL